jgi:hypothetical protein
MPSDASLEKAWERFEAEMARQPTDYELEEFMARFADENGCIHDNQHAESARAILSRYSSGQPAASAQADREKLMRAIVEAGQRAGIIRSDLETVSGTECLHILECLSEPAASAEPNAHTDDDAVDHFAAAMKEKLAQARAKGRHGWHECAPADLSAMLRAHVEKGDPRDVANFCMFLWSLGQPISAAPVAQEPVLRIYAEGSRRAVTEWLDGARDLPDGDHILFAAPVAAQAQPSGNPGELPVVNQQMTTDTALADTQRAIIEAAERRGYARAEAENVGYRTDAGRYRLLRRGQHWSVINGVGDTLRADVLDAAIDAARAQQEGQS